MNEALQEIRLAGFRGGGDYKCRTKGKSLVVLGGNGKGKSAIVDAIEFAFSGGLQRFRGPGTGDITEAEAIRHVLARGQPRVELKFIPSNATASRVLGNTAPLRSRNGDLNAHLRNHPSVPSFILRRQQLLRFIEAQNADRHKMFVRLLGLDDIERLQQVFHRATQTAKDRAEKSATAFRNRLADFREPQPPFNPKRAEDVRDHLQEELHSLGDQGLADWRELPDAISRLKERRPSEHQEEIDNLTEAISSLERALPEELEQQVATFNRACEEAAKLQRASAEAERQSVIEQGWRYMRGHRDARACPLCEREFERGWEQVVHRLKQRLEALSELSRAQEDRNAALRSLLAAASDAERTLARDLDCAPAALQEPRKRIERAHTYAARLKESLETLAESGAPAMLLKPESFRGLAQSRQQWAAELTERKQGLMPENAIALERCLAKLEHAREVDLVGLEQDAAAARKLEAKTAQAEEAFSRARNQAIESIFQLIGDKVVSYYRQLHSGAPGERPECESLEFQLTGRAAAGSLRLVADFLGQTTGDPRGYLSEAHLNSLGLSLYLACVKLFNPPGSLLVLDDVLTSIDRDHRHRVRDLLLNAFTDYQLVLTTHDEWWAKQIRRAVLARGEASQWSFKRIARWTVRTGPESSAFEATWDHIQHHLREPDYRELGGPLRCIFEDFLKRVADKSEMRVRYRMSKQQTIGDFMAAGFERKLTENLKDKLPGQATAIDTHVMHVFGTELHNDLAHQGQGRLERPLSEVSDFVTGLRALIKLAGDAGIIKGKSVF